MEKLSGIDENNLLQVPNRCSFSSKKSFNVTLSRSLQLGNVPLNENRKKYIHRFKHVVLSLRTGSKKNINHIT